MARSTVACRSLSAFLGSSGLGPPPLGPGHRTDYWLRSNGAQAGWPSRTWASLAASWHFSP
eukprot:11594795-Prorocentrum_lima.AAC.1